MSNIEHINEFDTMNTGRNKINKHAIDPANRAESNSIDAKSVANQSNQTSNDAKNIAINTDDRLDNIIAGEMQDGEVIDARKPFGEEAFPNLGKRLDAIDASIRYYDGNVGYVNDSMTVFEIRGVIAANKTIYFFAGTYIFYHDIWLDIPSDKKLIGIGKVVLKIADNAIENTRIMRLTNSSNVYLENLSFLGDRDTHPEIGEWGHGVELHGASSVFVKNCNFDKFHGDGFYVGVSAVINYCKDITLENCRFDGNRRQGISIVSVDTLRIIDSVIKNTNGTNPSAGIDFEPNNPNQRLSNILVQNVKTIGNDGAGILVAPYYLDGTSEPISINIIGHTDVGSRFGLHIGETLGANSGTIQASNLSYDDTLNNGILIESYSKDFAKIIIEGIKLSNTNIESRASQDYYQSAILLIKTRNNHEMGNITINNIVVDKTNINMSYYFAALSITSVLISDIDINFLSVSGPAGKSPYYNSSRCLKIKMPGNVIRYLTGHLTLYADAMSPIYSNKNASKQLNITLPASAQDGTKYKFIVEDAHVMAIGVASSQIRPLNKDVAIGRNVGEYIEMTKRGNDWYITDILGTWT